MPVYYKLVPWIYREFQIDLGTAKVVVCTCVTMRIATQGRLWFSGPVFDHIQWAYPDQKKKLLALLSYWVVYSDLPIKDHLLKVSVDYASGHATECNWLFTERVLLGGMPSLSLAQVLLESLEFYMRFEFVDD